VIGKELKCSLSGKEVEDTEVEGEESLKEIIMETLIRVETKEAVIKEEVDNTEEVQTMGVAIKQTNMAEEGEEAKNTIKMYLMLATMADRTTTLNINTPKDLTMPHTERFNK
jgi:hypothetical protein